MATELPLPKYADLPNLLLFHRQHPAHPVLLMQVPDKGAAEAHEYATYLVRLDREAHREWMARLRNAKNLLDKLSYEMHVAYCPQDGHIREMTDLDEPSYAQAAVYWARRTAGAQEPVFSEVVTKRRRLERVASPEVSLLRSFLGAPTLPSMGRGMIR